MKNGPSRIRGFFLFGGFVFLLQLFVEGPSRLYTHPFFTPMDDISRRLPSSLVAGVIVGLIYAVTLKKNP
jgi:hypothetical protein